MTQIGKTIRVIVADEQALCREGLALILSTSPRFTVVGQAASVADAADAAATQQPDVVVLSIADDDKDLEMSVQKLKSGSPLTKVFVLSTQDSPGAVITAMHAGAHGYVTKSLTGSELIAAIDTVHRNNGRAVVSISRESLTHLGDELAGPLTPRESEVLHLAAEALTNHQIASRLGIAQSTVKKHLTNIYTQLGADSRIDAINKAIASGLLRQKR